MKYNWPEVVKEFNSIVLENVEIQGEDQEHTSDLVGYFRLMVRQSGTFHPFNTDGELCAALDRMPERCNYRSIQSYWKWKNGCEGIEGSLEQMLFDVEDTIIDHFNNAWNFQPGYKKPKEITFKWHSEEVPSRVFSRILRAAKKA